MNISLACFECQQIVTHLPINDEGIYDCKAPCGHRIVAYENITRHELLFRNGIGAIKDGYFREAITSFHVSYEVFAIFYMRVTLAKNKYTVAEVDSYIKECSRRETECYRTIYYLENKCFPPELGDAYRNLRNKVVHRGYLPNREDAIGCALHIQQLILPVNYELFGRMRECFEAEHRRELMARIDKLPQGINAGSVNMLSPISVNANCSYTGNEGIDEWI